MVSQNKDNVDGQEALKTEVQETQRRLDQARKISDEARRRIQEELNALRQALEDDDTEAIEDHRMQMEALAEEHLADVTLKPVWREYAETIGLAVLCALVLRAFFFEAFKIPSGSMEPTLISGDHLFVNKLRYGVRVPFTTHFVARFADPDYGEVVVFRFPAEEAREYVGQQRDAALQRGEQRAECILNFDEKDFIKRIIGLPGDIVEGRGAQIYVNHEPLERTSVGRAPAPERTGKTAYYYKETIGERTYQIREDNPPGYDDGRGFGPIEVEEGHFFAVGDNRDNSADSRCWGQVPEEYIKGRAMFLWLSIEDGRTGDPGLRWDRFGQRVK